MVDGKFKCGHCDRKRDFGRNFDFRWEYGNSPADFADHGSLVHASEPG
jgi:hypothetical protein